MKSTVATMETSGFLSMACLVKNIGNKFFDFLLQTFVLRQSRTSADIRVIRSATHGGQQPMSVCMGLTASAASLVDRPSRSVHRDKCCGTKIHAALHKTARAYCRTGTSWL